MLWAVQTLERDKGAFSDSEVDQCLSEMHRHLIEDVPGVLVDLGLSLADWLEVGLRGGSIFRDLGLRRLWWVEDVLHAQFVIEPSRLR